MNAKDFVEKFRYSKDKESKKNTSYSRQKQEILEIHNSLLVTKTISPIVYSSLERVSMNLHINPDQVNLYIRGDKEINAKCYNGINGGFVIILNSEMVKLLKGEELDYVIGHELGHLLLEHTKEHKNLSEKGVKESRSKELSADRIGLIASRDLKATLHAIIKITSGLGDKFLKFKISEYLDQLRKFDIDGSSLLDRSTHPSFLIRAKALMLFSDSDIYQELFERKGKPISKIDEKIEREMDIHIEKSQNKKNKNLKESFQFWITCFAISSDNALTKEEQKHIYKEYGQEKLVKFKNLTKKRKASDVQNIIKQKISSAAANLAGKNLSIEEEINLVVAKISKTCNVQNLDKKIIKILNSKQ